MQQQHARDRFQQLSIIPGTVAGIEDFDTKLTADRPHLKLRISKVPGNSG
jgi:hypothetical protein